MIVALILALVGVVGLGYILAIAMTTLMSKKYCVYTISTASRSEAHVVWHELEQRSYVGVICSNNSVIVIVEVDSEHDAQMVNQYIELIVGPQFTVRRSALLYKCPTKPCDDEE